MKPFFVLCAALLAGPALAQQAIPDPRLEPALNRNLIVAMERSARPERTLPAPVERARPQVHEPELKRLDESLYIERRLLPPAADDPGAVRIYRRDVR